MSTTFPEKSPTVKVLPLRTSVIAILNQSGVVEGAVALALIAGNAGEAAGPQADRSWLINKIATKEVWKKILACIVFPNGLSTYNSPDYLKQRHRLTDDLVKNIAGIRAVMIDKALK